MKLANVLPVFASLAFMAACNTEKPQASQAQELLPRAGFSESSGSKDSPSGWIFQYNNDIKWSVSKDNAFRGEAETLSVVNQSSEKPVTLTSSPFFVPEGGLYSASLWLKAGNDAQAPKGGKLSLKPFLIHSDWGSSAIKTPSTVSVQPDWLEFKFDFYVPSNEIQRSLFLRFDISGSGSFELAKPSFKLASQDGARKAKALPLEERAAFNFDDGLSAKGSSSIAPALASNPQFVPGFSGKAVSMDSSSSLKYPVNGLLRGESGAISVWIRSSFDAPPTFNPTNSTRLALSGEDELGRRAELLSMEACTPGNFMSFTGVYGRTSAHGVRPVKLLYKNEWRHFIYSWDKKDGLRVYLDGRPFSRSAKDADLSSLSKIKPEELALYTAFGSKPDESAAMDELRLFNRALTPAEALDVYSEYVPAYPVLLDYVGERGLKKPLRVRFLRGPKGEACEVAAEIERLDGWKLLERRISIPSGEGSFDASVEFQPATTGDFRLVFLYKGKRFRTFEITAIDSKPISSAMPLSETGEVKLKLLEELDFSKNLPASRYIDDGHVGVVNSPLGPYREATRDALNSGFACNFEIKNPGKPHWLEIEYPDDKPRAFYTVVEQKLDGNGWGETAYSHCGSVDTIGVANGVNNPVTGELQTKRMLFWPDSKQIMVGCFVYRPLPGLAGPALSKMRLYENDGPLPRLAINAPEGLPERSVVQWNEDPTFPAQLWFKRYVANKGPSFDFWKDKLTRQIQYIRFAGFSRTSLQVFPYGWDNNGGLGVLPVADYEGHMPGWACLAAAMLDREGIPFNLQINDGGVTADGISDICGWDETSGDFLKEAAKGAASIESMSADGAIAHGLNFLQPKVREAHLKRIAFYRDQFGASKGFKGVVYLLSNTLCFRNERSGYEDFTTALFEKESGVKIDVADKSPERFGKRCAWLKDRPEIWEKWLSWRCAKVEAFLGVLAAELNKGGDGSRKLVCVASLENEVEYPKAGLEDWPAKVDLLGDMRAAGIDIAALSKNPALVVEPVSAPENGLLYAKGKRRNLDALWRSESFSDIFKDDAFPAVMVSRHANMEVYGWEAQIKKYWWPLGYWGVNGRMMAFSTALPDNKYLPQNLAWLLGSCDPLRVEHGWWGNVENGALDRFQKFYQAYRSIPALKFDLAPGVNDPVAVRVHEELAGGKSWLYMAGMLHCGTKVKVFFETAPERAFDATKRKPETLKNGVLERDLEPYQAVCFSFDGKFKVSKVEIETPKALVDELAACVARLSAGAAIDKSPSAKLLAEKAAALLKEKRYAALYNLSRSFNALALLKLADEAISVKASLNPDAKTLKVELGNRGAGAANGSLDGKAFSLQPGEKAALDFKAEGETEFKMQLKSGSATRDLSFKFRPVVARKLFGGAVDWSKASWAPMHLCDFFINFPAPLSQGHEPFPAKYAWAWDEKGLRLKLELEEKDFIPPSVSERNSWQFDGVELMIDQLNDANENSKELDSNDLVFLFTSRRGRAVLERTSPAAGEVKGATGEIKREGLKTSYELFLPASAIPLADLKAGSNIGFAVKLHNRERVASDKETWTIMTSSQEYPCNRPDRWNDLLLSSGSAD